MTDLIFHLIPYNRMLADPTSHTALPHIILAPVRFRGIPYLPILILAPQVRNRSISLIPTTGVRATCLLRQRFEIVAIASAAAARVADVGLIVSKFHVKALEEALQSDQERGDEGVCEVELLPDKGANDAEARIGA